MEASQFVPGTVALVGAGPGSADLITLRGLRRLRAADVVVHDALLDPALLGEVRPDAELVHAGKRGYCVGSTSQADINALLIDRAGRGLRVCRLKCGDPCTFGRGGEETEVLAKAGVRVEVVPGITSAAAVTAAAGIPLTHRDVGPAVTLVSGHHDPDSGGCRLDWDALARVGTLVFYMALRHAGKIAARLSAAGLDPSTPAAVVRGGPAEPTCAAGQLWELARLAESVPGPALLVVGANVRYRELFRAAQLADTRGVSA